MSRLYIDLTRLDFRQIEKIVHHLGKLGSRPLNVSDLLILFLGKISVRAIQQNPAQRQNGIQRCSELVGKVGKKAGLQIRLRRCEPLCCPGCRKAGKQSLAGCHAVPVKSSSVASAPTSTIADSSSEACASKLRSSIKSRRRIPPLMSCNHSCKTDTRFFRITVNKSFLSILPWDNSIHLPFRSPGFLLS